MSKTTKRIALAFSISALGFAGTIGWYNFTESLITDTGNSKEIARLVSTTNEVHKKSVKRIIWQPASENETLRVGEAIRTSSNSEARIEFLNSDTAIDLEPDSAIVLEENDGQIALDFIQGNIFVKSNQTAASDNQKISSGETLNRSVKLKSGNKEIALGKSEVSLGKNDSGELDLQVISGQIKGIQNQNDNILKVTNFHSDVPYYLNIAKNEKVIFEFEPTQKGYRVFVEAGRSRSQIKPVVDAVADGTSGKVSANLNLGRNYFRLVAKPTDTTQPTLASPILKTSVLSKIPPQPLFPEDKSKISVSKEKSKVRFLWSNPAGYKQLIVEISRSSDLKTNRTTEYIDNSNEFIFNVEKSGAIYWRVSGVLIGTKEVVSSSIQSFSANLNDKLDSPKLLSPKPDEKIPHEKLEKSGLTFTWKPIREASRYKITVLEIGETKNERTLASQKPIFTQEVQLPNSQMEELKPGQYSWNVEAIDDKGNHSEPSAPQSFTVHKIPKIEWADDESEHYYLSLKPTLPLSWKAPDAKLNFWALRIRSTVDNKVVYAKKHRDSTTEVQLPADGTYQAEVAAYDSASKVIARSAVRTIKVSAAPLLPAPKFSENTPVELVANKNGALELNWNQVDGAEKYLAKLKSRDGQIEKEIPFNSVEGSFDNLLPGQYSISLKSVDKHGRIGPAGEVRTITVPNKSNLRAPKLKGVTFK